MPERSELPGGEQYEPEQVGEGTSEDINVRAAEKALPTEGGLSSDSGLIRNSVVMGTGSVLSRITGVIRDISLTAALGLYITADAFALGNSLPDIIFVLIIGGALNAVFVPQLVRRMKDDPDRGKAYTDSLLSVTGSLLIVVTVLAVALAPWIVSIYATNSFTQEQLDLSIAFARLCLPQIFFYGIYAMVSQILNARGHFAMPMFAPIFNNLVAIATYVSFAVVVGPAAAASGSLTDAQTAWLGIGTTLGIVAQSLILIPFMLKAGYSWKFSTRWRGMGLRKAGRLAGWTVGILAVSQVGFIVASKLATQANVNALEAGEPPAGLAAYTKGYLVFMIPHGIVTVSIITAQLPNLSRKVHAGAVRLAGAEIGHTMRLVAVIIMPFALVILVGSDPLSALLFNYGAASAEQASQLGVIISIFMLGLLPFTLYHVLQRGWYAMENTKTPFLFAVLMNSVFVVLALLLFNAAPTPGAVQVNALAFAYSIANWVLFLVAWPALKLDYGFLDARATLWALVRIGVAALVAVLFNTLVHFTVLSTVLPVFTLGDSKLYAFVDLAVIAAIIVVTYVVAVRLLRVPEAVEILRLVWAKLPHR